MVYLSGRKCQRGHQKITTGATAKVPGQTVPVLVTNAPASHQIKAVLHSILRNSELEDCISLSQQHFQLLAELYTKMLEERKKSSIPNSVVSQTNVLFNREDLANDSQQQKINRAGPITFRGGYGKSGMWFRFRPGFRYSFRGSSTSSNFRFGAGRFGAKGKGKPTQPIAWNRASVPLHFRVSTQHLSEPSVPIMLGPSVSNQSN